MWAQESSISVFHVRLPNKVAIITFLFSHSAAFPHKAMNPISHWLVVGSSEGQPSDNMGGKGVRERGGRISSQDLQRSWAASYSQHAFSVSYHNECWYTTWYRGRQDLLTCSPRNARNSHLFLQFSKILCFYCLDTDKWVRMFSQPGGTAWKDVLPGCTSGQDWVDLEKVWKIKLEMVYLANWFSPLFSGRW